MKFLLSVIYFHFDYIKHNKYFWFEKDTRNKCAINPYFS